MLPYHTLEEAQVALGRGLTLAETLWFKYSANKSDFVLHCHNTLFLCLFYSIAPIPFVLMELGGYEKLNKHRIQPTVKRSFKEMFNSYKHVMHTFVIAVGPLQIISYPTIKVSFFFYTHYVWSSSTLFLSGAALLVLKRFAAVSSYVFHSYVKKKMDESFSKEDICRKEKDGRVVTKAMTNWYRLSMNCHGFTGYQRKKDIDNSDFQMTSEVYSGCHVWQGNG
ncbi:hypothetical protein Fmac_018076 [Flemingia macrophylla]|uniref:Uncharacterized protein n=1 Tax=Flemingia macrophylla TaxID=520843 RepID=A0ABD1M3X3_9FABA